jgi:hypothetical protein
MVCTTSPAPIRSTCHAWLPLCAAALAAAATLGAAPARAGIIEHADIGGFRTFQDTNTGRVWADLDNYIEQGNLRFQTYGSYIGALQAAGFTWATGGPVYGLLNTLPLAGGELPGYIGIMLSAYGTSIESVWGITDTGGPWLGQIGNASSGASWFGQATLSTTILNSSAFINRPRPALGGIWAYTDNPQAQPPAGTVPEPASLALVAGALLAARVARRRTTTPARGAASAAG